MTLAGLDLFSTFDTFDLVGAALVVDAWLALVDSFVEIKDLEVAEHSGVILLPRVVAAFSMDKEVALMIGRTQPIPRELLGAGRLRLVLKQQNIWREDDKEQEVLAADHVEIKVTKISLPGTGAMAF